MIANRRVALDLRANPTHQWEVGWRIDKNTTVPLVVCCEPNRPAELLYYDSVDRPLPLAAEHELALLAAADVVVFMVKCSVPDLNPIYLDRLRRHVVLTGRDPTDVPIVLGLSHQDTPSSRPAEEVTRDLRWPGPLYGPVPDATGVLDRSGSSVRKLINCAISAAETARRRGKVGPPGLRDRPRPTRAAWGAEGSAQAAAAIANLFVQLPASVVTAHGVAGRSLITTDGSPTAGLAAVQFPRGGLLHVDPVTEISTTHQSVDAWLSTTLATPRTEVLTRVHVSLPIVGRANLPPDEPGTVVTVARPYRVFFDGWWASGRRSAIRWALMTATCTPHYMRTDRTEWEVIWRMESGRLIPVVLSYIHDRTTDPERELELLRGADVIVFMAACAGVREQNPMQLERLRRHLALGGRTPSEVPTVVALNLRDASPAIPTDEVRSDLSWPGARYVETHACRGDGMQHLLDLAITMAEAPRVLPTTTRQQKDPD